MARWIRSPILNLKVGGSISLWVDDGARWFMEFFVFFINFFFAVGNDNCNDVMTSVSKSATISVFGMGPALKIAKDPAQSLWKCALG